MKRIITVLAVAGLAITGSIRGAEKEEEANLKDFPAAVQKAIQKEAAGGQLVRVEKETENGKAVYEAVIKKNGKELGYEFSADGKQIGKAHDEEAEHKAKK